MDIHTSHATLDYPLYVCDFDPADAGRLIVGGGGGASRTGVGNKIVRFLEAPTLYSLQRSHNQILLV